MADDVDDELTVGEVAALLGVSESTVRRMKELRPAKRLLARGDRRYRRGDVLAVLEEMRSRQADDA